MFEIIDGHPRRRHDHGRGDDEIGSPFFRAGVCTTPLVKASAKSHAGWPTYLLSTPTP